MVEDLEEAYCREYLSRPLLHYEFLACLIQEGEADEIDELLYSLAQK